MDRLLKIERVHAAGRERTRATAWGEHREGR
jgi:hypothetical protein